MPSRFSMVTPAPRSSSPAATRTGTDSHTTRRRASSRVRAAHRPASAASPARDQARTGVAVGTPASPVAITRAGRVTTSAVADTRGTATLSRSRPKRTAAPVTTRVMTSTAAEASRPPTVLTVTKSASDMAGERLKATAMALASAAKATPIIRLSAIAAATFWPTTESSRGVRRKVPVWMAVPRRLPSAPKMLPRRAMAAGTSSSRPGSLSRAPVAEARISPAAMPARAATTRAANAAPNAAGSPPASRVSPLLSRPRSAPARPAAGR